MQTSIIELAHNVVTNRLKVSDFIISNYDRIIEKINSFEEQAQRQKFDSTSGEVKILLSECIPYANTINQLGSSKDNIQDAKLFIQNDSRFEGIDSNMVLSMLTLLYLIDDIITKQLPNAPIKDLQRIHDAILTSSINTE